VRDLGDLPPAARAFIERVESSIGIPVTFVGTGQDRASIVTLGATAV